MNEKKLNIIEKIKEHLNKLSAIIPYVRKRGENIFFDMCGTKSVCLG